MKLNDLTFTGTELVTRRSELERTSVLKKLNGIYDEKCKLVFMFDVSGSMNERVARTYTDQYAWTPEIMANIKSQISAVVAKVNRIQCDGSDELLDSSEELLLKLTDDGRGPNGELLFNPADDNELQERIVRHDMLGAFGVAVNWEKHTEAPPTRIDLVKKLAKQELEARFKKYPDSSVSVIPFGDQAHVLFDNGKPDELWPALDKLAIGMNIKNDNAEVDAYGYNYKQCGSGTDILAAIRRGMDVCRKNPSQVGVHHFIVVSDGGDHTADANIGSWVPALKTSGVVLDYIHIGDEYVNAGLAAACKALGGEFVTVNSERDFAKKFVDAVQRKMLGAGK